MESVADLIRAMGFWGWICIIAVVAMVTQAVVAVHRMKIKHAERMAQLQRGGVDGILPPHGPSFNLRVLVLETATERGIPTMHNTAFWVERGALAGYGPDYYATGRQAARLVDKILNGADPAEIPVEVNTKIEFTINLKVAKSLGLTIPPEVLFRADRLIR